MLWLTRLRKCQVVPNLFRTASGLAFVFQAANGCVLSSSVFMSFFLIMTILNVMQIFFNDLTATNCCQFLLDLLPCLIEIGVASSYYVMYTFYGPDQCFEWTSSTVDYCILVSFGIAVIFNVVAVALRLYGYYYTPQDRIRDFISERPVFAGPLALRRPPEPEAPNILARAVWSVGVAGFVRTTGPPLITPLYSTTSATNPTQDTTCIICHSAIPGGTVVHKFCPDRCNYFCHDQCMEQWLSIKQECPICHAALDLIV